MRPRLKEARIRAGYTQLEVAHILGISQQCVAKHELGRTTPMEFKTMRGYEQLLGVDARQLFPDVFL